MAIFGGLVLLVVFCGVGRLSSDRHGLRSAAGLFVPVWGVAAVVTMAIGVLAAGDTVLLDLPILDVMIADPAVFARLTQRWAAAG